MLIECKRCCALVDASVHGEQEGLNRLEGLPEKHSLVSCPRCHSAMLAYQQLSQVSDADYEWDSAERLYPSGDRVAGQAWPQDIQDIYSEAVVCYDHRAYTASALMCRKVLEGMCDEHGYGKRELSKALSKMRDDGIIELQLFEWADALRLLGNEAAHGIGKRFWKADAEHILDFTEAILNYVFTYRQRFEHFKTRQAEQSDF